jgi:hypothetical protein
VTIAYVYDSPAILSSLNSTFNNYKLILHHSKLIHCLYLLEMILITEELLHCLYTLKAPYVASLIGKIKLAPRDSFIIPFGNLGEGVRN